MLHFFVHSYSLNMVFYYRIQWPVVKINRNQNPEYMIHREEKNKSGTKQIFLFKYFIHKQHTTWSD